jgi:hypothetical protein
MNAYDRDRVKLLHGSYGRPPGGPRTQRLPRLHAAAAAPPIHWGAAHAGPRTRGNPALRRDNLVT